MAGSGNLINYNLRTNKSIERNMMSELISCLDSVENYRYIGLGSKYFTDFILFHKKFGIGDMISLESLKDPKSVIQLEFNKPYECIRIEHESTTELLNNPKFPWSEKESIVWFDYDGAFCADQIGDAELCVRKLKSMSMFFISSSMSITKEIYDLSPIDRLTYVRDAINEEKYTKHLLPKDMAEVNIYSTFANIMNIAIMNSINMYNKGQKDLNKKRKAEQIAFFKYSDSTPMITIGWIVYDMIDEAKVKSLDFNKFSFYIPDGMPPYTIKVPPFTYKELAVLNKHMPNASYPIKEANFISKKEISEYEKVYRYYPTTIETGLVL